MAMFKPQDPLLTPPPKCCYLHTLTFADPEPSYVEARARWNSFQVNFLNKNGWYGVCVPQWGEETRRLHFHLVTSRRPDSREWWQVLPSYGFGRYDVRQRPVVKAAYAARYVGRGCWGPKAVKGARTWSVFGAKLFPFWPVTQARDVRITEKARHVIKESPHWADECHWSFAGHNLALRAAVRPYPYGDNLITKMREITQEQSAEVLRSLASGNVVGVGEYRAHIVTTKSMRNFKTGQKEDRVVINHEIDFGAACVRRTYEELLPQEADASAITPPAQGGELVLVTVDGIHVFGGKTTYKGGLQRLGGQGTLKLTAVKK